VPQEGVAHQPVDRESGRGHELGREDAVEPDGVPDERPDSETRGGEAADVERRLASADGRQLS
jgi:hypothetical protein